jgi:outer membrane protein assembly factor BamE (lipoprotein component of BamABCDE complex)
MKKFFKIGCLGLIGLIVLFIIIGVATSGGSKSSTKTTTSTTTKSDANLSSSTSKPTDTNQTNATTTPASNDGVLTKEKFDKITDGMTYDQVKAIVGSDGELLSESGDKGTEFYTEMYQFKTDGFLSNSTMMFQGGKLINKSQVGLGGNNSNVKIDKAKYDQIQNGMTYEQVQQIAGGEGEILSESGQKGTDLYTIMVQYEGNGDLGANVSLMFQGNKLQTKAQFGLK